MLNSRRAWFVYIAMSLILLGFLRSPLQLVQILETIDGDTVVMREKSGKISKLRLSYIDAPEWDQVSIEGQAIGQQSTELLRSLLEGRQIYFSAQEGGLDRYGRRLGVLWAVQEGGRGKELESLNWRLVREGQALLYPFAQFQSRQEKLSYLMAFNHSMRERRGMWASKGFLSPYYHRRKRSLSLKD